MARAYSGALLVYMDRLDIGANYLKIPTYDQWLRDDRAEYDQIPVADEAPDWFPEQGEEALMNQSED